MEGNNALKGYKIYIYIAIAAVIMVILFPYDGEFRYVYQKGRPWIYETLMAPFDFPILKNEAQLMREKEEKASKVIDYFVFNERIGKLKIEEFNTSVIENKQNENIGDDIIKYLSNALDNIYSKGISSLGNEDKDKIIFIKRGKRAFETPAAEVYNVQQAYGKIYYDLSLSYPEINAEAICKKLKIETFIVPNLIYDKNTSQLLHKEAINYISPTMGMIYTGQLIVSKGEIVTSEIEQMLDSYKAEYIASFGHEGSSLSVIISHILIVLSILSLLFITIFFTDVSIFESINKYIFILMLYLILFAAVSIVGRINNQLLYIIPFSLYILYTMAFFKPSFVFPTYIIALLPLLLITNKGMEIFTMNAIAGSILLISFSRFNRGWLQFINSIFVFIGIIAVYIAFNLQSNTVMLRSNIIYMALNALLVIIGYPFIFLFEKIFSLISSVRLWEMTDTNNVLLQELAHKAPGTFQHSIQVANLAEDAARKIGANSMLVRVGAMYHDVGKIANPQCFIENQAAGIDFHKNLTPEESAREIIKHVDDGITIGKKYHLPETVIEFIRTHHGKSQTLYFYNLYCNNGGNPENKEPFTYKGDLPTTKEQVVIMMADAVEAASRTLKSHTLENISSLVNKILETRLSNEQLSLANISIHEINIVKECFINYIMQIYHERIVYPRQKTD